MVASPRSAALTVAALFNPTNFIAAQPQTQSRQEAAISAVH